MIPHWLKIRWLTFRHPHELHDTLKSLAKGTPWYSTAQPLGLIQHWAPDIFVPLTFCGRLAGKRSSSEIRTVFGWHCWKCSRRAKRYLIRSGAHS